MARGQDVSSLLQVPEVESFSLSVTTPAEDARIPALPRKRLALTLTVRLPRTSWKAVRTGPSSCTLPTVSSQGLPMLLRFRIPRVITLSLTCTLLLALFLDRKS